MTDGDRLRRLRLQGADATVQTVQVLKGESYLLGVAVDSRGNSLVTDSASHGTAHLRHGSGTRFR